MTIGELWSPNYDNKDSQEYKNITENIAKAIEGIYDVNKSEDNQIYAQIVDIR